MVALLYSCTIALVAIPLAPTTALLVLLLHVVNFKFDKFILMYLQKKPVNPWGAKDAGSFFIKFYFCTVLIFLGFTHFFLLNTQLVLPDGVGMFGNNFVPWMLLFIFLLITFFLRNSLTVYIMTALQREQDVALTFSSLRRKIKQLENRLRLQKMGGGRANDSGGAENAADR
ncbi:Transmembrane channel protein 7 [Phytophthora cinnamomi]|uniref:Transmembrane channel protein 7 n=1 Tax=Phytophthora cinnamomi TaxID=4785 RepID=UPI003559A701|nr:Transmembrane channel protein 7 [Phytophthora cinnamomi]